jgi:hypothetical protein
MVLLVLVHVTLSPLAMVSDDGENVWVTVIWTV